MIAFDIDDRESHDLLSDIDRCFAPNTIFYGGIK
jgi:hypothetical protein